MTDHTSPAPLKLPERYEFRKELGRGGMGEVYLAFDRKDKQLVAIKMSSEELLSTDRERQRFLEEARVCSMLHHENIVGLRDNGELDNRVYLVFDYIEGTDLGRVLEEKETLPVTQVLEIASGVLAGLSVVHERGIVHRDIKPANILLRASDGRAFLLDFGAARAGSGRNFRTRTGVLLGTPFYMAPELLMGTSMGPAVDIYALGCAMYECVTGQVPFDGETKILILEKHMSQPPIPPRQLAQGLDPAIESVILRAMEKDPSARFADAGEMLRAVEAARRRIDDSASMMHRLSRKMRLPGLTPGSAAERSGSDSSSTQMMDSGPVMRSRADASASSSGVRRVITAPDRGRGRWALVLWGGIAALVGTLLGGSGALSLGMERYFPTHVEEISVVVTVGGDVDLKWSTPRRFAGVVVLQASADEADATTGNHPNDIIDREPTPTEHHHQSFSNVDRERRWSLSIQDADGHVKWTRELSFPKRRGLYWPTPSGEMSFWAPLDVGTTGFVGLDKGASRYYFQVVSGSYLTFKSRMTSDIHPEFLEYADRASGFLAYRIPVTPLSDVLKELEQKLTALDVDTAITRLVANPEVKTNLDCPQLDSIQTTLKTTAVTDFVQTGGSVFRLVSDELTKVGLRSELDELDAFSAEVFRDGSGAATADALRLYGKLSRLQLLDVLLASQREVDFVPFRRLVAPVVTTRYRLLPPTTAAWVPGSALTRWSASGESIDRALTGLGLWFSQEGGVVETLWNNGEDYDSGRPLEAAVPNGFPRLELRARVSLWGPAYYFRVRFESPSATAFEVLLTHPGQRDWYRAMDGLNPQRTTPETVDPHRFPQWGEVVASFPRSALPPGQLSVRVSYETLPGFVVMHRALDRDAATSISLQRPCYVDDLAIVPDLTSPKR